MVRRMSGKTEALQRKAPATLVLLILFVTLGGSFSNAGAAGKRPMGDKILDKYIEATGGVKAYDKLRNSVTKMTLDIPAVGVKLDVTVYSARPNKFYSIATSPAIGSSERGTDGTVYWEKSTMQGSRILEGDELAEFKLDAVFERMAYWRSVYDKAECTGVDTVAGKPCYKVVLTDKNGKAQTLSFDQKSNLLAKVVYSVPTQMGTIPLEAISGDYRKVGDFLVAHRSTIKIMGQDRIMTTTGIEFNAAIPDSIFAVPRDVQELTQKK